MAGIHHGERFRFFGVRDKCDSSSEILLWPKLGTWLSVPLVSSYHEPVLLSVRMAKHILQSDVDPNARFLLFGIPVSLAGPPSVHDLAWHTR